MVPAMTSNLFLKWCLDHALHPDVFIGSGNRIVHMWLRKNNLRFVDTLQFFQQPLADLSDTYDIDTVKGHFPHHFNTRKSKLYCVNSKSRSIWC